MSKTEMTIEQFAEQLINAMKTDIAGSYPRSSDFESGKMWVLRRAELLMRDLLDTNKPSPGFTAVQQYLIDRAVTPDISEFLMQYQSAELLERVALHFDAANLALVENGLMAVATPSDISENTIDIEWQLRPPTPPDPWYCEGDLE